MSEIVETIVYRFDELSDAAREKARAYLSSDEVVDETIAANDYIFTETGRRFG